MSRLYWVPLAAALAGCPPSIDTGDDGGGVIFAGPEGGIFIREGAAIEIPKNALAAKAQITVTVIDSGVPEVPGRKRVSFGYRFSPSSLTFNEPVKITLPYLTERVPAGVDVGTFDMRRQAGDDAYLQLPGARTVTELLGQPVTLVEAKSERLGLFWVTSPAQPAVSKIELSPPEAFLRVGDTQQFGATVTDPAGNPLALPITWSVLPPRVATIDGNGLLTATGPGTGTVTARAGSLFATAVVRVQGSAVGPQTFVHDNPFPTGNDLWGGALVGTSAFFVGANATVLSRAAGDVWTRHFSNPGVTLRAVGGTSLSDAVAVGTSANRGVLVEVKNSQPVVTTFDSVQPRAMWFDGTHGMAVGQGNDVLVRRNGTWVREYSPSFEILLSVLGNGAGGFTTLGNRGSLYAYDPATTTWNSLFQTQLSVLLTAGTLANAAGSEAWAAGGDKLWHFAAGAWTAINLPATPALDELTALALLDGKVVLAGRAGRAGHLLTYEPVGGTWTSQALRGPQIVRGLFGQGAQGYAVGDFGAVWEYAAGAFTEVSRGFYGNVADVAVAGSTVVAAVNECANAACTSRVGKVMVRTGASSWSELGTSPFVGEVSSVAVGSSTEVLAGGVGQILRFDGSSWAPVTLSGGAAGQINDIQYCGSSVFAVSAGGFVFRGNAAGLQALPPPTIEDLHAVHCASPSEVFIAGDRGLFELSGNAFAPRDSPNVNHGAWRAVWTPGQSEAFAFGDARYGVYWNTAELSVIDAPGGILPDVFSAMWGSSVDNLYAVGYTVTPLAFAYAVRFDGADWKLIDSGSQRRLTSMAGGSATEIWLGGEGGGVLRGVAP
ncbi:MAG: Ig-like domain-containing protein [Myxococcota bacterium]